MISNNEKWPALHCTQRHAFDRLGRLGVSVRMAKPNEIEKRVDGKEDKFQF